MGNKINKEEVGFHILNSGRGAIFTIAAPHHERNAKPRLLIVNAETSLQSQYPIILVFAKVARVTTIMISIYLILYKCGQGPHKYEGYFLAELAILAKCQNSDGTLRINLESRESK